MRTLSVAAAIATLVLSAWEIQAATIPLIPQKSLMTPSVLPMPLEQKEYGILQETPNQRRHRLGQEIKASYPPLDLGEAVETPNQRRRRLGQPIQASYEPASPGVAEETPNHRRARLALK